MTRLPLFILLPIVAFLSVTPVLAADAPTVASLLNLLPSSTLTDEIVRSRELLQLGPTGLKEVAALIVPLGTGDDTKARYALSGLTKYVTWNGHEGERAMYAAVLLDALAASKDVEVKTFFLHELQSCGKEESVTPIAGLLSDSAVCEPATQALCGIRTSSAAAAIAKALPGANDGTRITLVKACGYLRIGAAADDLLKIAGSPVTVTRMAALYSLADLGESRALPLVKKATEVTSPLERVKATSFYLLLARRMAEGGHKADAAAVCREVFQSRIAPDEANVRAAALSSLVDAVGADALPDLVTAANSSDIEQRAAALRLGERLTGENVTAAWVRLMTESAIAEVRAETAEMLARRGDAAAVPAILALIMGNQPASVRLAAIQAAAKLGGDVAVPALLTTLTGDDAPLAKAAAEALAGLPGDGVLKVAGGALLAAKTPGAKIALLGLLGSRAAHGQSKAVLQMTADGDATVRIAALKAMAKAGRTDAEPVLLKLATGENAAERAAALDAAVAAAQWSPDPANRADAIITALLPLKGENRATFIRALVKVPTPAALDCLVTESKSADADVQEAAVRTLAGWPDVAAIKPLLEVNRAKTPATLGVIALRGVIQLTRGNASLTAQERAYTLGAVIASSRGDDEKRLGIAALAAERGTPALKVTAPLMDDHELAADAALAVVKIVTPAKNQEGLRGPQAAAALRKAAALVTDAHFREQAEAYLKRMQ